MYHPIVTGRHMPVQTVSNSFQKPFFFGGSNVVTALHLDPKMVSGQGIQYKTTLPVGKAKIHLHLPK
jgi:hypothetical protein